MTRVLVVDDIQQNRYLLGMTLNAKGYEVISTKNGAEALEAAAKSRPDLIISDILMPVMDGFELCRRVKQNPDLNKIPFIFYTATYTDPRDEKLALSLGADRFIIKPQMPEVLLQTVDEVLEENRNKEEKPRRRGPEEVVLLKEYNEALFRKLEEKVLDLEADIAQRKVMEEREEKALVQLEENLERLAALNDQIRNPLSIIVAQIRLIERSEATDKILEAVRAIDDLVTKLDDSWEASEKVREFMIKHSQITGRD